MRLFYLFLMLILLLFSTHIIAQTSADTIRPGQSGLVTRALKPGLRQYLVCYQNPKTSRQLGFWYWLRDIAIDKASGKVTITQHWYGSDTSAYRSVYSVNAAGDFAPLYHQELVRGKLNAYNWTAADLRGADSVDGNAHKGFYLAFAQPNYNWNLDIETFEMLPLAAGRSFLINFYDAGLDSPRYVRYTVTGSEKIGLLDGQMTDCWKLHTEDPAKGTVYSETYWISKKDHQFLKEEDHFNGMIRYKIRMPDAMPDLRTAFDR